MSTTSTKYTAACWDITTDDRAVQTITVERVDINEIHLTVDHDGLNADGKGSFSVTADEAMHLSGVLATLAREARR